MDAGCSFLNVEYQIEITGLGDSELITDETPLARYMKLETLIMWLQMGRVFIPSHRTLRGLDPFEGDLLFSLKSDPRLWEVHRSFLEQRSEPWVREAYDRNSKTPGTHAMTLLRGGPTPASALKGGYREWLNSLSEERLVWCWNIFRQRSNALWRLYGHRGVMVRSTVGKVRAALLSAGVRRGVVGPVSYIDRLVKALPEVLRREKAMQNPHFLKDIEFEYEREVRFILAADRNILRESRGGLAAIRSEACIDGFEVSPELQREEGIAVETLLREISLREKPAMTVFVPLSDIFTERDSLQTSFEDMPKLSRWPSISLTKPSPTSP